ncbi:hypothetical protein [Sphingomonas sp. PWP1-2]|uniref:hypothetical protein n=1 Tax=Sphingomonas sp. PWP1-2 TaxID=2804558 RepID=UPI003CF4478F
MKPRHTISAILQGLLAATVILLSASSTARTGEGRAVRGVDLTGFGYNIDDSLINPTEPGRSEGELTEQISGILHTVKIDGGRTVRWFVTGAWPQYACARDPENQTNGDLDPAWFTISRILLQQAQKLGISVVVVMADTADGTFASLPRGERERAAVIAGWQRHRSTQTPTVAVATCKKSFQSGYYGRITSKAIFEDPETQSRFATRFLKMARFLRRYPALAGLEMFNEPEFAETERPEFGRAIVRIRSLLYRYDPSLRAIPISSGVAAWNTAIVEGLAAAGALAQEPYINIHYYPNAAEGALVVREKTDALIAYLRRIIPGRPIIISEAGAGDSVYTMQGHAAFVDAILSAKRAGKVGLWMWGTYANDLVARPDFKWEFASSALSGGSLRSVLAAVSVEDGYRYGRTVEFAMASTPSNLSQLVAIRQIDARDQNPLWRLRWQIIVGGDRFIGISRAGILLRVAPAFVGVLSEPAPSVAISTDQAKWAEVSREGSGWRVNVFQCLAGSRKLASITAPYVRNYAKRLGLRALDACYQSTRVASGMLS